MDYCGPKGIPHDEFLRWSDYSQDAALAWHIKQQQKCQTCGMTNDEWLDEKGHTIEPAPYEVVVRKCIPCSAVEQKKDEIKELDDSGLQLSFRRPELEPEDE